MKLNLGNPNVEIDTNINTIVVPEELRKKIPTGITYIDDALGGTSRGSAKCGITPSNVVFFTGGPGAGKTRQMMQLADSITGGDNIAVFNTNEQSLYQVKMQAELLRLKSGFICAAETQWHILEAQLKTLKVQHPGKQVFFFQDSLQTLADPKYPNEEVHNGKTPERALAKIASFAKAAFIIPFIIGQVNKDGNFAGHNKLLHMVDTHMHLCVPDDPDANEDERYLEVRKNRFGCSGLRYHLIMRENGLRELNSAALPSTT